MTTCGKSSTNQGTSAEIACSHRILSRYGGALRPRPTSVQRPIEKFSSVYGGRDAVRENVSGPNFVRTAKVPGVHATHWVFSTMLQMPLDRQLVDVQAKCGVMYVHALSHGRNAPWLATLAFSTWKWPSKKHAVELSLSGLLHLVYHQESERKAGELHGQAIKVREVSRTLLARYGLHCGYKVHSWNLSFRHIRRRLILSHPPASSCK